MITRWLLLLMMIAVIGCAKSRPLTLAEQKEQDDKNREAVVIWLEWQRHQDLLWGK